MCLCRLCNFRETKTAIDFGYQPIVHNLLSKPSEKVERFQEIFFIKIILQ